MERNILVIGKVSQGKTGTIKSLKTHSEVVCEEVSLPTSPETKIVLSGNTYRLFDTISFFDPDYHVEKSRLSISNDPYHIVDPEEPHMLVLEQIQKIIKHKTNAVLFVLKGTERFTRETRESISVIKRFFGNEFINRIIFVITYVDESKGDFSKMHAAIESYLGTIGYSQKDLNDRFIDFDNTGNPRIQIDGLVEKMEKISTNHKPYSLTDFNNAQNALKEEKRNLAQEKEIAMQKQMEEEKLKLEQVYSKEIKALEKDLDEKQLELAALAETKSNKQIVSDQNKFNSVADAFSDDAARSSVELHVKVPKVVSTRASAESTFATSHLKTPFSGRLDSTQAGSNEIYLDHSKFSPSTADATSRQSATFHTPVEPKSVNYANFLPNESAISNYPYNVGTACRAALRTSTEEASNARNSYEPKYSNYQTGLHQETVQLPHADIEMEKSLAVDRALSEQKRVNDAKVQEMEDFFEARRILMEEHNAELKQLQQDVKNLAERPPIVVYEEKPNFWKKLENFFHRPS